MSQDGRHQGIVVLGLPRSGTTLVRRILNAHPSIACGGESFLLRATARFFESDTITDGIDYGVIGGLKSAGFSEQEVRRRVRALAFSFLEEFAGKSAKPRWAVKSAVDSFYLAEIEKLYAGHVQFVCIVRHGLDAACSLEDLCAANEVYIKELHAYVSRYARPMEAYAHAWRDVTRALLDFAERNTEQTLLIRYEDLVGEPEKVCNLLLEFLGEARDPGLLARALAGEMVQGLGDWKTHSRSGIDAGSVGRWKTLRQDIVSRLGSIANPLLVECGYEQVPVEPIPGHDEAIRRYELLMRFNAARSGSETGES